MSVNGSNFACYPQLSLTLPLFQSARVRGRSRNLKRGGGGGVLQKKKGGGGGGGGGGGLLGRN